MSGLKGNVGSLSKLASALKKGGVRLQQETATKVAPAVTALARGTFAANENAYGDAWPLGKSGNEVTLVKSGRLRDTIGFVATGTKVRCVLGVKYARYHIGRFRILPGKSTRMPINWEKTIERIVAVLFERSFANAA